MKGNETALLALAGAVTRKWVAKARMLKGVDGANGPARPAAPGTSV